MGHHESMCIIFALCCIFRRGVMWILWTIFPSFCVSRGCGGELFALSRDGASENSCNLLKMLSKSHSSTKTVRRNALTLIYDVNLPTIFTSNGHEWEDSGYIRNTESMLHLRGLKQARPFWLTYFLRTPPISELKSFSSDGLQQHTGWSLKVSTVFPQQHICHAPNPPHSLCLHALFGLSLSHTQTHKLPPLASSLTPIWPHYPPKIPQSLGSLSSFSKTQAMVMNLVVVMYNTAKLGYFRLNMSQLHLKCKCCTSPELFT